MLVNLHLDTGHCFSVSGSSTKIVPKIGVSLSPLENIESLNKNSKNSKNRALRTHNGKGLLRKQLDERTNGGPKEKQSSVENPRTTQRSAAKKNDSGVHFAAAEAHAKCSTKWVKEEQNLRNNKKPHTKCSTKWAKYGGCLPAILRALDEISDIDEALKPWEESLSNKERSIILKEQTNWERALEILEWFKIKGCYEINVIHYNIVLRILGRARKWSHVESLWDDMCLRGISPVNSTYGTLIDSYSKAGLTHKALEWLVMMNERGMSPDEVTMATVVQLYKKSGNFRKAEEFFKKWSRSEEEGKKVNSGGGPSLSSHTYNTLIDTYGKAGQFKEASDIFARMLGEGICPTTVTFNTMIHISGNHGSLEEVTSLMKKMEELRVPPSTRTYNILISLYAKHNDIAMATEYFSKMKEARLEPDPVSYRTLLYAYSIRKMVSRAEELVSEMDSLGLEIDEFTQSALTRMYIEAGEINKSWSWFRRFHLRGKMSSECYSANIDAYGERGFISKAEEVFKCCRESDKLTVIEFNVMIKACGIAKRYRSACDLFDSMNIAPDKCSFRSLIQILAGADMALEAVPYLRAMQRSGFVEDCIPYCAVISSFAKLGNLEMVECLYKEMVSHGVKPDVILFGIMINVFTDTGYFEKALGYVEDMKKTGLPFNEVICNLLIKLYTKVGYLKEARAVYDELEGPAMVYSSNCMIELYSQQSMVGPAEEILEGMKERGEANEFSYAMMMRLYTKIGRFEDAVAIARRMRDLNLFEDLLSYNSAIALYAACGQFRDAAAVFNDILRSGLCPDDCTFRSLGAVLVKSGVSRMAVAKLEALIKSDSGIGIPKWVSALDSVVGADFSDDDEEL